MPMRTQDPTCFESLVDMLDRMMMMTMRMMRWLRFWMTGGAVNTVGGLGNQIAAEPEYKSSMMERAFRMVGRWLFTIVFIYLVVVYLISNFAVYGDLKSQSLDIFKRRVHYYNLDEQLNGIASLLPVHFF